jgi:hypothetical protein
MSRAIHHWPIRKNVTVVAAVTALPKGMIILKMKKGVLSIGHCEAINHEKFKGPPRRAFFILSPEPCGLSSSQRTQRTQRKSIGGCCLIAQ